MDLDNDATTIANAHDTIPNLCSICHITLHRRGLNAKNFLPFFTVNRLNWNFSSAGHPCQIHAVFAQALSFGMD